ncbi:MAG TPA: hypothetical protein VH417_02585 [Vicinamibacterales bacterium]
MRRLWMLAAVVLAAAACRLGADAPAAPDQMVTIVLAVDPAMFAPDGTFSVELWDAQKQAALEANARCATVRDANGQTGVQCPPGVTYREVTPARFTYTVSSLGATVQLPPQPLAAGETFRLRAAGPSRDRCNVTSSEVTRAASSDRVTISDLPWQTTARACAPGE